MLNEKKCKHQCSRISQIFRSSRPEKFCWKAILKKFIKLTRKLLFWSPSLVLRSWTPLGLCSWRMFRTFSERYFHKNCSGGLLLWFWSNNANLLITWNIFYKTCARCCRKLYDKESFHLQGEYSLIICNCCYDFQGT